MRFQLLNSAASSGMLAEAVSPEENVFKANTGVKNYHYDVFAFIYLIIKHKYIIWVAFVVVWFGRVCPNLK